MTFQGPPRGPQGSPKSRQGPPRDLPLTPETYPRISKCSKHKKNQWFFNVFIGPPMSLTTTPGPPVDLSKDLQGLPMNPQGLPRELR